ncbi:double-stranded RNA-binding protein Staufen homolog 2 isoform X2 [Papio anubis]|uniref:double-stranded RNA-binding protein Staufen homolog 2 isoform X2 n=1 Tax=Papio anubis TaxID=9555 RepID=UPI0012ADA251|nr:double-stranded RNA-binding protein Staufen homolog 2 isoform X2 [Papio anubis]XP_021798122.2 double-stranded RNA-binding protein Staufen homolog 2 isoform X2 [Papio anubis]
MLQINQMFSVQLSLGEQTWESEGSSIKKAQQAVANKALTESTLPKPVQKPPKSNVNNNPGSITPTVELNGLAMKRGEPAIYRPLDPKPFPNYRANYNFRGMYNQRYHCPVPKIFYVQLTVGNNEFFGEGKTRQAARHNAAMKALQALQNEPIPERSPQNGESGKDMDDDKDANKSEISLVFEIALKRNMPVSFEVIKESGPPHMKSFVTRVSVGEFSAEGEGNSKKLSKKRAATTVLQELKKLPPLPVVEKPKLFFKKRPKTIVKAGPEYGQGMNPISRLAQIQQAKKEKEPDYVLLSERGMPRRREFVMQVKVGNEVATGTGPNKKIAKKNAAEAMLLQLGYKASTNLQDQLEKTGENKGWSGPKPGFPEPTNNTPKGILHLSPDVYQEMEASRHKVISGTTLGYLSPKDMNQPSSSFFSISPTSNSSATIARELLMNGTSSTAEAIGLKGSSPTPPCSPVQPSKQLEYLARIQGFQSAAGSGKTWTLNKQTRRSPITLFIKWKGTSVCLCEKGERSKFFIHNHCNVWEPPLLLQKIHKSPFHFLINVQWLLEVFSGRERPSSLSSIPVKIHICQPPLLPPTRINDRHRVPESFLEVILENPFKRSSLHHFPN